MIYVTEVSNRNVRLITNGGMEHPLDPALLRAYMIARFRSLSVCLSAVRPAGCSRSESALCV